MGTVNDATLELFEWELQRLIDLGKTQKKEIKIKPYWVVYDSNSKKGLVLNWNLEHNNCPFLKYDNTCSIYEKRPLVCQSFPFISSGLIDYIHNIPSEIGFGDCPNKIIPPPFMGSFQDHAKNMSAIYGNIFNGAIRFDMAKIYVRDLCDKLNSEKVINRRTITPKIISKIKKHEPRGLFRYAIKNNAISQQDFEYTIAKIEEATFDMFS